MATATENGNTPVTPVFKAAGFVPVEQRPPSPSRCVLPSSRDRNSYLSCVASPIMRTDNSHTPDGYIGQKPDGRNGRKEKYKMYGYIAYYNHCWRDTPGSSCWVVRGFLLGFNAIFGRSWGARDCLCELFQLLISSSYTPFRIR